MKSLFEFDYFVNLFFYVLQGEDPSTGNPNFWDELFLLKVSLSLDYFVLD